MCLRLPQHTYDEASGDVALVSASPSGSTMGSTNGAVRSLNASFAAADGKAVLNSPTKSTILSSTGDASPVMTRFFYLRNLAVELRKVISAVAISWIVLMHLDSRSVIIRSCCLIHQIRQVPK